MSEVQAVGIDLGTTYSAVATVDAAGRTSMLRSMEGDLLTPSVVLFEPDETIVGRDAKKALELSSDNVAECVKRDMGSAAYSRPINGQMLRPEVIQACILRKLRADTVAALGENIKVVITVPAFFDEPRRKATADAGEMAGLEVLNIVNEPTAAALSFGENLGYLTAMGAPREQMRVLVYDLGGGTFDVTLIELKPGEITTLATDGDVRLGGYDWDSRLLDYVAGEFQKQTGVDVRQDPTAAARLRHSVEEAKHTLTARPKATVHFEHHGTALDLTITQELFEELTADLLERTAYTTRQMLSAAKLQWSDISRILLVGGSSRMPMVSKMLHRVSGIAPDRSVNADEAVARGAAIFANYLLAMRGERQVQSNFQVVDVNSHSLGIEGIDQRTMRKENIILIPRNTPLPAQATRNFVTKEDNQPSVVIQVLEGESHSPGQCTAIGRAVIRNLPPGLPKGTRIDVIYRYAANARLSVRAKVAGTQNETGIDLEREQGLSTSGLSHWKRVITSDGGFDAFMRMIMQELSEGSSPIAGSRPMSSPTPTAPLAARPAPIAGTGGPTSASIPAASVPSATGSSPSLAQPASPVTAATPVALKPVEATPLAAQPEASPLEPANEVSVQQKSSSSGNSTAKVWVITILGHILAATFGLAIGYYVLCLIQPAANFLNLRLPGVRQLAPLDESDESPSSESPSTTPSEFS